MSYKSKKSDNRTAPLINYVKSLSEADRNCHRAAFLQFLHVLTGSNVTLNLADGASYSGIFHTATPFPSKNMDYIVAIKCAKAISGSNDDTCKDGSTFVASSNSFATVVVDSLDLNPKGPTDLLVDSAIRSRDISHLEGRSLESVSSSWLDPSMNTSFEGDSNGMSDWNQFETNMRLFNVRSSYDENLYTTKLDSSSLTREKIVEAERLAREIEGGSTANIHLQEERGQALQREVDEEDLYSGVIREQKPVSIVNSPLYKSIRPPGMAEGEQPWKRGQKISAGKPKEGDWRESGKTGIPTTSKNSKSPTPITKKPTTTSQDNFDDPVENVKDTSQSQIFAPPGLQKNEIPVIKLADDTVESTSTRSTPTKMANVGGVTSSVDAIGNENMKEKISSEEMVPRSVSTTDISDPAPATQPSKPFSKLNPKAAEFTPTFSSNATNLVPTPTISTLHPVYQIENSLYPGTPYGNQVQHMHQPGIPMSYNQMMQPVPISTGNHHVSLPNNFIAPMDANFNAQGDFGQPNFIRPPFGAQSMQPQYFSNAAGINNFGGPQMMAATGNHHLGGMFPQQQQFSGGMMPPQPMMPYPVNSQPLHSNFIPSRSVPMNDGGRGRQSFRGRGPSSRGSPVHPTGSPLHRIPSNEASQVLPGAPLQHIPSIDGMGLQVNYSSVSRSNNEQSSTIFHRTPSNKSLSSATDQNHN